MATQSVNGEILALCSGDFGGAKLVTSAVEPSTSMHFTAAENDFADKRFENDVGNDEEEFGLKKKRKKIVLDSDSDAESDIEIKSERSTGDNVLDSARELTLSGGANERYVTDEAEDFSNINEGYESESFGESDSENEEAQSHEEPQQTSDVNDGELDSSDDELAIYNRLKNNASSGSNGDSKSKGNHKFKSDYIEEEASLSGDDVGSDIDEDEGPDEYEAEEGDKDELPDQETIKEQLHKQWLKQQQDEEDRRLLYWKEQLLTDGDLYGETDRTFRLKLREEDGTNVLGEDGKENTLNKKEDDENEDEEIRRKHIEMVKWKLENNIDEQDIEINYSDSQLLSAGIEALQKQSRTDLCSTSSSQTSTASRNSLLQHRSSLSLVVNQNEGSSVNARKGLFVSRTQEELQVEDGTDTVGIVHLQKKSFFTSLA